MAFCTKCGTAISDSASLCNTCAAVTTGQPPPPQAFALTGSSSAAAVAVAPAGPLYYVSTYGTGHVSGPFTDDTLRSLIVQQQVTIRDAIAVQGSQVWMPITQTNFGVLATQQANLGRIAASTCPRCGAGMAVVIKRSGLGLALVIIGIALTPAFGIGIPIFIVGYLLRWGGKGTAAYRCPQCNYST